MASLEVVTWKMSDGKWKIGLSTIFNKRLQMESYKQYESEKAARKAAIEFGSKYGFPLARGIESL